MTEEIYVDSDGTELTIYRYEGGAIYKNSKNQYHRLDGPAFECDDGTSWYQNDKLHRLDGPAREWADGDKEWYQNDDCHRLDGPAIEWADGTKEWWQNDLPHRLDGPAVEWPNGHKEWCVEGKQVEPLFLVSYWLERGRCCWFDEEAQELRFGDV